MKKIYKIIIIIFLIVIMNKGRNRHYENTISNQEDLKGEKTSQKYVEDGVIDEPWETKGLFEFQKAKTTKINNYMICDGTDLEIEVTELIGLHEGPTIFILAGQHGDEVASYTAINKLKDIEINRGKVIVISPANIIGSNSNPKNRYVKENQDLNRSFPGKIDGNSAELLAYNIYGLIKKEKPTIVLDHHEARVIEKGRDFLGSCFIYTSLEGMEDLFLEMYQATQNHELCAEPYNYLGPAPAGSMNSVVSSNLNIPVITIETYRGYVLERRVEEHIAVVGYILKYFDMV